MWDMSMDTIKVLRFSASEQWNTYNKHIGNRYFSHVV